MKDSHDPRFKTIRIVFHPIDVRSISTFFLTVGLGKASAELVAYMNDAKVSKSILEWVVFGIGAPLGTAFWCLLWIWFKKSEKHCIELFGK